MASKAILNKNCASANAERASKSEEKFVISDDDPSFVTFDKFLMKKTEARPLEEKYSEVKAQLESKVDLISSQQKEIDDLEKLREMLEEKIQKMKEESESKTATIKLLKEEKFYSIQVNNKLGNQIVKLQTYERRNRIQNEVIENLKFDMASYLLHLAKTADQLKECTRENHILSARTRALAVTKQQYENRQLDCCADNAEDFLDLEESDADLFDVEFDRDEDRRMQEELNIPAL